MQNKRRKKPLNLFGKFLLAMITMIAFFFSVNLLFGSEIALVVTFSIALHELGHAFAFHYYGMTTKLFFIPFLGAAVSPDDTQAFEDLDWKNLADIALAGPFVNMLLMIICAMLGIMFSSDFMFKMAGLNAALAALNLVPLSILDGGRYAKAIFSSMTEKRDKQIARFITGIAVVLALVMLVTGRFTLLSALVIFGAHRESTKDDPAEAHGHRAMSELDALRTLVIYTLLLLSTGIGMLVLPTWLSFI